MEIDHSRMQLPEILDYDIQPSSYEDAGLWKRFGNLVIDSCMIWLSSVGIFFFLLNSEGINNKISSFEGTLIICHLFHFLYYFVFEKLTGGKTLGKIITNTIVVDIHGREVSTQQYVLRSLIRLIPLYFLGFLKTEANGWQDRWTKTMVIENKKINN